MFLFLYFQIMTMKLIRIKKSFNTIYFTSIIQTAQRTCRHVLEGTNVGILLSYMVEETAVPSGNHRPWTVTITLPHANAVNQTWAAAAMSVYFTPALSRLSFDYVSNL